jgi:MATE family multidrug resistance protein
MISGRAASYLIAHVWPLILLVGLSCGLLGIFQACGKQLLCAKYNFACLLMIGIPMGLVLARHFDYGLIGLWYGNLIGLSIYAITGFFWISKLDWEEMTRDATRFTHVNFERPAEAF